MTNLFSPTTTALLLALAAVLGMARLLLHHLRAEPTQRSHAWRIVTLLIAQPLCAALLHFALWPPTVPGQAGTLVVATAGTDRADAGAGETLVALPEAPAWSDADRAPDLATALRRHPGTQRIRVIGAGLEARDRDAASGLSIEFAPSALPRGLVEVDAPQRIAVGDEFHIAGRAAQLAGGLAELIDPARRPVDRVAITDDGRFRLTGTARGAGGVTFRIRLRDARKRVVEEADVPLLVDAMTPPRVLVLAGAPGPEVKYLRRWLDDAGLPAQAQIAVGGGVQLGDTPIALNAESLSRYDVAIIDERAWSSMGEAQRGALEAAVRDGLGVLVRVTGPLSASERGRLRALGFAYEGGRDSTQVKLATGARDDGAERARIGPGTQDAPRAHDEAPAEVPELSRRDARLGAADSVALAQDADGTAIGSWRAQGRGRIGVWLLGDSYRLVLGGRGDLHAALWSDVLATLARPQARPTFDIQGELRQDRRVSLCGVRDDATVTAPDGTSHALLRDPATGTRACAAFWPGAEGWHSLRSGDRSQAFFIQARDAVPGLQARALRDATLQLAAASATVEASAQRVQAPRHPGARWPWWTAWLCVSAALWWLERSRAGRRLSAA